MSAASDLKFNVLGEAVVRHISAEENSRNRASHAEYYRQRTSAGLIIIETTNISPMARVHADTRYITPCRGSRSSNPDAGATEGPWNYSTGATTPLVFPYESRYSPMAKP